MKHPQVLAIDLIYAKRLNQIMSLYVTLISDRVAGAGCFGASLMLQADLVANCMKAIAEAANGTPVTVKCRYALPISSPTINLSNQLFICFGLILLPRLGVDEVDSYEQLQHFVSVVSEGSPVRHFIVHARKCFLKGLNPHQNRTVPPLRHEWVYSLRCTVLVCDLSLLTRSTGATFYPLQEGFSSLDL